MCFHGDSKASHTDTEDEPLHLDIAACVGSHFSLPFKGTASSSCCCGRKKREGSDFSFFVESLFAFSPG